MPVPRGLHFINRIAKHPAGVYFLCRRKGHPKALRRFDIESDAREYLAAHDFAHHNSLLRGVGFEPARNAPVDVVFTDWLNHIRQLEIEGVRSPDTTRHYELVCAHLRKACKFAGVKTARDVTPERISSIVAWFRKNTKSEGATIVKALSAMKTMFAWKALPRDWKIPHDEIRAQPREKKDLDSETIRKLIAAMPAGSLEEAAAYLKARTGARDVEIYRALPSEFDLELGVFAPNISKRTKKVRRHAYALTDDVIAKVRPFVERAKARGGYVFHDANGKPMTTEKMRPLIRAASRKAGLTKTKKNRRVNKEGPKEYDVQIGAIDSIAQIRAEIVTVVDEERGIAEAARHIGHRSAGTSERWYAKDRLTKKRLEEKRRVAQIIADAIPLGGTTGIPSKG